MKKDVKPYALMVGVPAKQIGWMSEYGEKLNIPIDGEGEVVCPHIGETYVLKGGNLKKVTET